MAHTKLNVSKNPQTGVARMSKNVGTLYSFVKQGGVATVSLSKNFGVLSKQTKGP